VFGVDVTCSENVTNVASTRVHYVLLRQGIVQTVIVVCTLSTVCVMTVHGAKH